MNSRRISSEFISQREMLDTDALAIRNLCFDGIHIANLTEGERCGGGGSDKGPAVHGLGNP